MFLGSSTATFVHPSDPNRSTDKPHVSDILAKIARSIKVLKDYGDEGDLMRKPIIQQGFAWEDYWALRMKAGDYDFGLGNSPAKPDPTFIHQPGELERDGIVGSPDGFRVPGMEFPQATGLLTLQECKSTYKKPVDDPEEAGKWWMWLHQMQSYCAMTGGEVRHAELWAKHVRGDYKNEFPTTLVYRFEWTKQELEQTWEMVLRNAE